MNLRIISPENYKIIQSRQSNPTNNEQISRLLSETEYGYDEQYRLAAVEYGDTTHQGTPNADGTVSAGNAGYTFDAMGNRLTRLDNGTPGNLTAARTLDVYGAERGSGAASTATSRQGFVGSLGHTTDSETGGLVYMRARYMDATTGRFISQDPKQDGVNWFVYTSNNPVNRIDADGQLDWKDIAELIGIPVGGVSLAKLAFRYFVGKTVSEACAALDTYGRKLIQQGATLQLEAAALEPAALAANGAEAYVAEVDIRCQQFELSQQGITRIFTGSTLRLVAALLEDGLGKFGLLPESKIK